MFHTSTTPVSKVVSSVYEALADVRRAIQSPYEAIALTSRAVQIPYEAEGPAVKRHIHHRVNATLGGGPVTIKDGQPRLRSCRIEADEYPTPFILLLDGWQYLVEQLPYQCVAAFGTVEVRSLGGDYPNQPSGLTVITERPFNSVTLSNPPYAEQDELGWFNNGASTFSRVDDSTAPKSPTSVGRMLFPAGMIDGVAPAATGRLLVPNNILLRRIYYAFWFKFDPNWVAQSTGNKVTFVWHHEQGSSQKGAVFTVSPQTSGDRTGPMVAGFYIPDRLKDGQVTSWSQHTSYQIVRGRWYRAEIYQINNTPGLENGELHVWVTDITGGGQPVKIFQETNFGYVYDAPGPDWAPYWYSIEWNPTYGGNNGDTVPQDQYMWMDHFYVSGAS